MNVSNNTPFNKNYETEKCILCNNNTDIFTSMPIDERIYFISGCGQLCKKCYSQLQEDMTGVFKKM